MDWETLYGKEADVPAAEARYRALKEWFGRSFEGDCRFFSSPGRIEILGNHTDHNHGKVLVGSISADMVACVAPGETVVLKSKGYPDMVVRPDRLEFREEERGTSLALVKGVLAGMQRRGYRIGGFCGVMDSTIFKGAGVSSSAAFEVLICEIENVLYNGGSVPPVERAKIAQEAENVWFGKPCGLLDQSGIALGGISEIDFRDPETPVCARHEGNLGDYGVVLVNTGGDHCNLTQEYAAVRAEMEAVAAACGKEVLRDLDEREFLRKIPEIAGNLSGRAILRAMHFYDENRRVEAGARALSEGDLPAFFEAVNGSGESSERLLQNVCVPGETAQRIPLAVEYSRRLLLHGGAARVHGGGFAGTILAFVHREDRENYLRNMRALFGANNVFCAGIRKVGTCCVTDLFGIRGNGYQ